MWNSSLVWTLLTVANYVLVALAIGKILRHPREPRGMLAWILGLILLPVLGLILFVMIGRPRLERTVKRRRRRRQQLAIVLSGKAAARQEHHAVQRLDSMDPGVRSIMQVADRVSSQPATHGNCVTLHLQEEKSLLALKDAIESAKSHVHLEYYIFKTDETGQMIREALMAKARAGVRCRLLMDYIGSWSVTSSFTRPMTEAGVEVDFFLPVSRWQGPWRINFRNHRKLLVVDGQFGFTGSHNIGNEYRGKHPTLGSWQDTNLSVVGPAVHQLQDVFVEDWFFTTGIELTSDEYFPPVKPKDDHIVQVIASGPDSDYDAIHDVLFAAICSAQDSIHIMTPYFVPEAAFLHALKNAAYRGVKVWILIPSKTDNRLVLWAGRSFYEELSRAGVQIFEYDHGMLHNKVTIVDGCWSMVGSANMDQRSFRLNFELSTVLYDSGLAAELLEDFNAFLTDSRRIPPVAAWSYGQSLVLGAARLVSPIL